MDVRVSRLARWYLRRRGGQLYVWGSSIGGRSGTALLRTSTKHRPTDVDFEQLETDGLTLWFDKGLTIDNVELGFSPFAGGIEVTWPEVIPTATG
jgi:hypothetical protein